MSIECMRYTPVNKGTLKGFATVFIEKWGVEINSISHHKKDNKEWIGIPSQSYEKDGEKKYAPYFRFKAEEHYKIFSEKVLEAVKKKAAEIASQETKSSHWEQEEIPF